MKLTEDDVLAVIAEFERQNHPIIDSDSMNTKINSLAIYLLNSVKAEFKLD
jgi:hypothetical protein